MEVCGFHNNKELHDNKYYKFISEVVIQMGLNCPHFLETLRDVEEAFHCTDICWKWNLSTVQSRCLQIRQHRLPDRLRFNCFLFSDISIYRGFLTQRLLISQATHHNHHTRKNSASVNISIHTYQWALYPLCSLLEFWLEYSVRRCVRARAHACVCERYHSFHFPSSCRCLRGMISPFEQHGDDYSRVWLIETWTNIYFSRLPESGRKLRQLAAEALCTARVSFLFSVALFNHEHLINKSQQWRFFFPLLYEERDHLQGNSVVAMHVVHIILQLFHVFLFVLFIFPHPLSHRWLHLEQGFRTI